MFHHLLLQQNSYEKCYFMIHKVDFYYDEKTLGYSLFYFYTSYNFC